MAEYWFYDPVDRRTAFNDGYARSGGVTYVKGREAYDGTQPIIITHLAAYIAGKGGSRTMRISFTGKCNTGWISIAADSQAEASGYRSVTSGDGFVNDGGTGTFQVESDNGEFYYGRSDGGGTISHPYGTWTDGGLTGTYRYSQVPTAPGTPVVTVHPTTAGRFDLDWSAPSDDGDDSIHGYNVYAREVGKGWVLKSHNSTSTATSWTGLTPGKTYEFAVAARNGVTDRADTQSKLSGVSGAKMAGGVPSAPQSLTAVAHATISGRVDLDWAAPSTTAGTITGYRIFQNGALVATLNGTTSSYTRTGLTPGTSYSFYVQARNAWGDANGTYSPNSNTVTASAPGLPSAPQSLVASASINASGRIGLSWSAPAVTAGGITGYNIYRDGTAVASVSGSTLSANIDGNTVGTTYAFTVRARNAFADLNSQEGPDSNSSSAMAPGVPSAPTSLTATPSTNTFGRVALSWTAPSVTAGGVTFYNVYADGVLLASPSTTSYTANGLTENAYVRFDVRARNNWSDANGTYSAKSNDAYATVPGRPSAPLNLTAVASEAVAGRVDLDWDAPTTTGTGGITRYRIYHTDGTFVAETNGTTTAYTITGLVPATSYAFYVTAYNAVSDANGTPSPQSNTATSTALGEPDAPTGLTVSPSTLIAGRLTLTWTAPGGSVTGYNVFTATGTFLGRTAVNSFKVDGLTGGPHSFYVRARNAVTDTGPTPNIGGPPSATASGTPSGSSTQTVPNHTVTDSTNQLFNGDYTVTVGSATTLTYAKVGAPAVTARNVPSGTAFNKTNADATTGLNGTFTIAIPTTTTLTYTKTTPAFTARNVVAGTATNNTNIVFNTPDAAGTSHGVIANVPASFTVTYTRTAPDISSRASSAGTLSNISNAALNGTGITITAVTAKTFTYNMGTATVADSPATGIVLNNTNRAGYNGVHTVDTVPSYNTFTYGPVTITPTSQNASILTPFGDAKRTTSQAHLTIKYRSGWAG